MNALTAYDLRPQCFLTGKYSSKEVTGCGGAFCNPPPRQADGKFQASLGYIARCGLKNTKIVVGAVARPVGYLLGMLIALEPAIPVWREWRQENQKFEAILSQIAHWGPA